MNNNVLWLNKLVPKHVLLDDSEIEKRLKPLQIEKKQLPKILLKDPALDHLWYVRETIGRHSCQSWG